MDVSLGKLQLFIIHQYYFAVMNKYYFSFILVSICVSKIFSQIINVAAAQLIKTFDHNPVAINLNYLMDDDGY